MTATDMSAHAPARDGQRFVRSVAIEPSPPPSSIVGPIAWMREHLFTGPVNIILTLLIVALGLYVLPGLIRFMFIDAVWSGADREACIITPERPVVGACWAFVRDRAAYFTYGAYPMPQRWRVDVFFTLLAVGVVWLLWLRAPRRDIGAIYAFVVLPIVSYLLLVGAPALGLPYVETTLWGGILVTIVCSAVGIVVSLPLGILLALGRRSTMPAAKLISVIFIEFVRGVPLITVLFMASVMLPLFVPYYLQPDKLLRALIGIALFASAYMAEVVRAGLQAMPKGQYEGAMALGLPYVQMMRLIILPQALKVTIPNIVNTYIGLFKDTTLVVIVGIFDFLKAIEAARIDPRWAAPTVSATGYAYAAVFYFTCCYLMSRYARTVEARLAKADKR
ncbi:amino acid ABC transporter permease [Alsobacter sp. SYSU M60028]|uniref:Amino acid ABC transporter permease n=1 Tax=Alsobacter ponti TaxID=2962936 RepID=A0ABT1LG68_9HYPH|nr:amino acid ABC transporter permease [Alsobacter ponti]MCP8939893.1 amino acid ABC transporter permease [Alsobacter ponti]